MRDQMLFSPRIRIRDEFFPDPDSRIPDLFDFAPKTIRSKIKEVCIPGYGMKKCSDPGSGMKKCLDPDPGQNIPDPDHCLKWICIKFQPRKSHIPGKQFLAPANLQNWCEGSNTYASFPFVADPYASRK
jgi:hypothetical protein